MPAKRRRPGRPRKIGKRHANGKLVYRKPDDRQLAAQWPHRRDLPESERLGARAVTELGRLQSRGIIHETQCVAGEFYGAVVRRYYASCPGPRQLIGGSGRNGCDPNKCEADSCICLRRKQDFQEFRGLLVRAGERVEMVTTDVCYFDRPTSEFTALRVGLIALAKHLRLGGK